MRTIDSEKTVARIVGFIRNYASISNIDSLVVGVSGGVDSALVSTLCAMTKLPTFCTTLSMKWYSPGTAAIRARDFLLALKKRYENVSQEGVMLGTANSAINISISRSMGTLENLAKANLQSRLGMRALYAIANSNNGIVVGTGNLVEDYGVGFFTKYGDGGVDISPIGALYKSEVYQLAKHVGVPQDILEAAPEDGLWEDGRTDEDQLGVTYGRLEAVMEDIRGGKAVSDKEAGKIYDSRHLANKHKMEMPLVCKIQWEE